MVTPVTLMARKLAALSSLRMSRVAPGSAKGTHSQRDIFLTACSGRQEDHPKSESFAHNARCSSRHETPLTEFAPEGAGSLVEATDFLLDVTAAPTARI